jgi:hypothetical protein
MPYANSVHVNHALRLSTVPSGDHNAAVPEMTSELRLTWSKQIPALCLQHSQQHKPAQ